MKTNSNSVSFVVLQERSKRYKLHSNGSDFLFFYQIWVDNTKLHDDLSSLAGPSRKVIWFSLTDCLNVWFVQTTIARWSIMVISLVFHVIGTPCSNVQRSTLQLITLTLYINKCICKFGDHITKKSKLEFKGQCYCLILWVTGLLTKFK